MSVPTELDAAIAVVGGILTAIAIFCIPRQNLDRVPMSGLFLLLIIHAIVGWVLAISDVQIGLWLVAAGAVLIVAMIRSLQLGQAGAIALGGAAIGAIVWAVRQDANAQISALAFLFLGIWLWAVGGARYRMESAGFGKSIRWVLAIVGWEGLWIGWLIDTFVAPQVGIWLR
ncbi:hypothetical protein NIES2135_02490 [Leptolyngbya boryana NIES-2135]|jgi:hypothetical protein|uniref:Uncharacterized protein n=1 Tax=Leptolyngbya boryana NIES-2135 TaxID=1973484 RepID=A0A1Z4J9K7_LEPBY|nr:MULTISPECIES: hypothetical protein [Leptolyngbya]BAY53444.1 hypothetical protein NIES2135_02490 [Leptolyngbya boryana NIES-2135]MBD2366693.1 hypothetical protein [Leptolyngbya sp. FACHB-161]MBD2373293.1 hypothetical protein [Leptolyngbya sp. FACHB-238]MBD2397693.1 hypothetical protein [Leptolyngbya sp. FACHB-239]MBD2404837.1 hypothetical protein [Leptolyngbya sp. FACHB-402]